MKIRHLLIGSLLSGLAQGYTTVSAQQPFLEYAMINSCGIEGSNEFFVINTGPTSIDVNRLRFEYSQASLGAPDPIVDGRTPNIWVAGPTGAGTLTSTCTLTPLVSGSVPANSRILVIPSLFGTPYNVSNFCMSGNLYILYFNTSLATSWTTTFSGNFANTAADPLSLTRFMRVLYYDPSNVLLSQTERSYLPNSLVNFQGSAEGAGVRWTADPLAAGTYVNTGCNNAVLPLDIISFSGLLNDEHASFSAELAGNDLPFDCLLEKSEDGRLFSTIQHQPIDASSEVTKLQFTDPAILTGKRWYRLKLLTADRFVYSKILMMQNDGRSAFTAFFSGENTITVSLYAEERQETVFRIIDPNGRVLLTRTQGLEKGLNTVLLKTKGPARQFLIVQALGRNIYLSKKIMTP